MTNQEAFDIAYKGLAAQGFRRSIVADESDAMSCRYRGPNGLKCAIGHLIPDSLYQPEWDQGLSLHRVISVCGLGSVRLDLINAMQNAHDSCGTPSEMNEQMRELANDFDLTIPQVSEGKD